MGASYTAQTLVDTQDKTQAEINQAVETAVSGLTPISIELSASQVNQLGYNKAYILPLQVTGQVQFWAKDSNSNWYDINTTGWGHPVNGFQVTPDYSATTNVFVIGQVGTYSVTLELVDLENQNAVIAENAVSFEIQ